MPGKMFVLIGGGTYTVPSPNTLTATVTLVVGAGSLAVTTPAAPVGTGADADLLLLCTVQSSGTTLACHGKFVFTVVNVTTVPVPIDGTLTFNPATTNLVDLQGNWNGTVTTQTVTVTNAGLLALN